MYIYTIPTILSIYSAPREILRSHNGRDMYAAWLFFGLSIEANKRRGKKKKEKKLAVC